MLLPSKRVWTRQPLTVVGLDPDNEMASRFVAAYMPAISSGNLASPLFGSLLPTHANPSVTSSGGVNAPFGLRGVQITASSGGFTGPPAFSAITDYPVTLVWVGRVISNTAVVIGALSQASLPAATHCYMGGASSTLVTYNIRNNFSADPAMTIAVPGGSSLVDVVFIATSRSATDHAICVNGSAVTTSSTNAGAMFGAYDRVVIGNPSGTNSENIAFFGVAKKPFTNDEIQWLSASPTRVWQLFKRRTSMAFTGAPVAPPVGTLGQFDPELRIAAWF